jgi:hypothetical protein
MADLDFSVHGCSLTDKLLCFSFSVLVFALEADRIRKRFPVGLGQ